MARPKKYTAETDNEIIRLRKQFPKMSQTKIAKKVNANQSHVSKVLKKYSESMENIQINTTSIEGIDDLQFILASTLLNVSEQRLDPTTGRAIGYLVGKHLDLLEKREKMVTSDKRSFREHLQELPAEKIEEVEQYLIAIERILEDGNVSTSEG